MNNVTTLTSIEGNIDKKIGFQHTVARNLYVNVLQFSSRIIFALCTSSIDDFCVTG